MKIGLHINIFSDKDLSVSKDLIRLFSENGIQPVIEKDCCGHFPSLPSFDKNNIGGDIGLIVTVGGDGTILSIITQAAEKNIPVLGVNMGKVGFLTELEKVDVKDYILVVKNKKFAIEKRIMLQAVINGQPSYSVLNEWVVNRAGSARMLPLEVYVGGRLLDNYYADGFLVATPTGSTAYSLSAGGPVLAPDTKCINLIALNSHSLHNRPVVVGEDKEIEIKIMDDRAPTKLIADGEIIREVTSKDKIIIKKSKIAALFVRLKPQDFYARLLNKLNNWS
jgi:NAD+ kinase